MEILISSRTIHFCHCISDSACRQGSILTSQYLSLAPRSICLEEWPGYLRASEQWFQDKSERKGSGRCSILESPLALHCRGQNSPALPARGQVPNSTLQNKSKAHFPVTFKRIKCAEIKIMTVFSHHLPLDLHTSSILNNGLIMEEH